MLRFTQLLLFSFLFMTTSWGQDLVYKRDGKIIKAEIIEIRAQSVVFWSYYNEYPERVKLNHNEIEKIIFENGEVRKFGLNETPNPFTENQREAVYRNALKFEILSPLTNHLGFNFERAIKEQIGVELKIGIIGYGSTFAYGKERSERYIYGESNGRATPFEVDYEDSREKETGFFVKIGPKWTFTSKNSLRGWYAKPEILYSQINVEGISKPLVSNNTMIGVYNRDFTYRLTYHSIGGMATIGYQTILANRFTFDISGGIGVGYDFYKSKIITNSDPDNPPRPHYGRSISPDFRYSHMRFSSNIFSLGLSFGVLL